MKETLIAILAAGRSSRFGGNKLEADFLGKPVGRWALDAAQATGCTVVWIAGEGGGAPKSRNCITLVNGEADKGIGTSIALAARHALVIGADRLLIMLADMPLVNVETLQGLLAKPGNAACVYASGEPGVPAIFMQSHLEALANLAPESGAKALLMYLPAAALLEVEPPLLRDIDTPEALATLVRDAAQAFPNSAH